MSYSDFLPFYLMSSCFSSVLSKILHCIELSCLFSFFLTVIVSYTFFDSPLFSLYLMTLRVQMSSGWVFCRMSFNLSLSVFLMIMLGFRCSWEEDHRAKVTLSSQYIKGTYYPHDLSLLILTLITGWSSVCQVSLL